MPRHGSYDNDLLAGSHLNLERDRRAASILVNLLLLFAVARSVFWF
jgi:hypothetical protein